MMIIPYKKDLSVVMRTYKLPVVFLLTFNKACYNKGL
jgi:hypothetical protein